MSVRHNLKGAKLDCKLALDRYQAKEKETEELKRKIFVGGLPRGATDQCLFGYFSNFGSIEKAYIVKHSMTGASRGFGFVLFQTIQDYSRLLDKNMLHYFRDKQIFVRATISRKEDKQRQF